MADKDTGAYCMSFDRSEYLNPEREAREWFSEKMRSNPDYYGKYEVRCEVVQTEVQVLAEEAADRIEQLLRGEFICKKCGLRKDAECAPHDF